MVSWILWEEDALIENGMALTNSRQRLEQSKVSRIIRFGKFS